METIAGQPAATMIENIATSINADPTLVALGVRAAASGETVHTTGTFSERVIEDPGFMPAAVPGLSPPLPSLLGSLVAAFGLVSLREAHALGIPGTACGRQSARFERGAHGDTAR